MGLLKDDIFSIIERNRIFNQTQSASPTRIIDGHYSGILINFYYSRRFTRRY